MSIAQTIVVDIEKFLKGTETDAEKFAVAFARIFKKAPTVIQTVENFVNEAAPIIAGAVSLADPIAEPAVAAALAMVETALAAIQASASAAVSGQSLVTNLQNFAGTVPSLLSGLAIKNTALQGTISRIVSLVTGEAKILIPAVQAWASQLKAASPAPSAA